MLHKFIPNTLIEAKTDFPFIIIQPNYGGKVSYIRPDIPDKVNTFKEDDFIKYLFENWPIVELEKFEDAFNQYFSIILHHNGAWEIYEHEKNKYSFNEIVDFNKKLDEKEQLENQKLVDRVRVNVKEMFEKRKLNRK